MNKKNLENMTIGEVRAELTVAVDQYNATVDTTERASIEGYCDELCAKYNELSLLSVYTDCAKAEMPIKALVEAFYYKKVATSNKPVKSVVGGKTVVKIMRSINETNGKLVLAKFLEWGADGNRNFAASNDWRSKVAGARKVVISEWEKFFKSKKDTHSMSIGKTKKALQAMFDSLLFIKCENSDKNAVIASGDIAKAVLGFSNKLKVTIDDEGQVIFSGTSLSNATWAEMQMVAMHMAICNKTLEVVYGDPEETVEEVETASDENKEQ